MFDNYSVNGIFDEMFEATGRPRRNGYYRFAYNVQFNPSRRITQRLYGSDPP